MKLFRFPIIIITIFIIAGIGFNSIFQPQPFTVYMALFISFLSLIFIHYKAKNISGKYPFFTGFLILTAFLSGILLHQTHQVQQFKHQELLTQKDKKLLLKIKIIEKLKNTNYYHRYYAQIQQIDSQAISGKLLIKQPIQQKELEVGNRLTLLTDTGQIAPIQAPKNPYDFDYRNFLKHKGIAFQINLTNTAYSIENKNGKSLLSYTQSLKKAFENTLLKHQINGEALNLAKALFLGERYDLDPETVQNFQAAGTIHILAISGLHIGILLLFINFLLSPLTGWHGRLIRIFISIAILWFYAYFTGFSPSVLRAVIMFSFLQIGLQLKRETNIYNTLFAAAFFMVIFQPGIVFSVGFQMSFLAVLSIVSFYPVLRKIYRPKYKILQWWWDIFLVSMAAQAGVFPISLYYFHQFPVYFFLSNLIVIPLLFIVLIYGFSLILLSITGIKFDILYSIFKYLLDALLEINHFIAHLKHSLIQNIYIDKWQLLLLFSIMILLYFVVNQKHKYAYLISFLSLIIVFQSLTILQRITSDKTENYYVFHQYNQAVTAKSKHNHIVFYTDSTRINPYLLKNFRLHFNKVSFDSISFVHQINRHKILHIDSLGVYQFKKLNADIVCLHYSPKINLEKMIVLLKPKMIIADASNYPSYVNRWQKTAKKYQIFFYDTKKNGAWEYSKFKEKL